MSAFAIPGLMPLASPIYSGNSPAFASGSPLSIYGEATLDYTADYSLVIQIVGDVVLQPPNGSPEEGTTWRVFIEAPSDPWTLDLAEDLTSDCNPEVTFPVTLVPLRAYYMDFLFSGSLWVLTGITQ